MRRTKFKGARVAEISARQSEFEGNLVDFHLLAEPEAEGEQRVTELEAEVGRLRRGFEAIQAYDIQASEWGGLSLKVEKVPHDSRLATWIRLADIRALFDQPARAGDDG